MWQETKRGLYKQFVFSDFQHAWSFMEQASVIFSRLEKYPRWQNERAVVDFWIASGAEDERHITEHDRLLAEELDALAYRYENTEQEKLVDKIATNITEVQLYTDGGSRGNPGPSASGFVVLDMSGKVLHREGAYLGITTNNQAEYQALKLGLEYAKQALGAREVHVYMDSMLVVNQMKNIFKVRNRELWPVHDAVKQLITQFKNVSFDHVPRELNKLADVEVNKCLDAEQSSQPEHIT